MLATYLARFVLNLSADRDEKNAEGAGKVEGCLAHVEMGDRLSRFLFNSVLKYGGRRDFELIAIE